MQVRFDPRLLQAEWLLGRLPPEALPRLAADMLAQGYDGEGLQLLAGMSRPDRSEVGSIIEAVFSDLRLQPIDRGAAAWIVVKTVARRIVNGDISPYDGAREISSIAALHPELTSLNVLSGLASEWEDDIAQRSHYDEFIVEEARDLLEE